jgi:hypothetical protein
MKIGCCFHFPYSFEHFPRGKKVGKCYFSEVWKYFIFWPVCEAFDSLISFLPIESIYI